ncbi:MAG: diadenylate cyclase CdaA [Alkalispirochaeta sp.]|jgi:diadenylate cyclase
MTVLQDFEFVRQLIIPALDVLLLSFLIYKSYHILVQTRAVQLVRGALFLGVLYAVSFFLNLSTVLWIINILAPSFVIGIAIIFQPELRKIFTRIGQGTWLRPGSGAQPAQIDAVMSSAEVLSYRKRGALIVFTRSVGQKNIIETGTSIDAEVSSALILTIFSHDTELHDGAVVVENGRIVSAGCFLPLSEQMDVRRSFGTRHRAALGLAEESDAVVLIVSEETGAMSLAHDSNLYYDLSSDEIRDRLSDLLNIGDGSGEDTAEEVAELAD